MWIGCTHLGLILLPKLLTLFAILKVGAKEFSLISTNIMCSVCVCNEVIPSPEQVKLAHSVLGRILLCFLFSLFFAYLFLIIIKLFSDQINLASPSACVGVGAYTTLLPYSSKHDLSITLTYHQLLVIFILTNIQSGSAYFSFSYCIIRCYTLMLVTNRNFLKSDYHITVDRSFRTNVNVKSRQ